MKEAGMKIGITGGIGSGKSYVCRLLEKRGISVYDCDSAAKRLMNTSPQLRQQLTELIGPEAYEDDNVAHVTHKTHKPHEAHETHSPKYSPLNKAAVTRFLMSSADHAAALDAIVHPAVFQDFEESGMLWMESAILFESGIYRLVDKVVAVSAPEIVRLQRIMTRDGITEQKARQWIERQWPQDEVCQHADFVIINDGLTPLNPQIELLLQKLEKWEQERIEV